MPDSDSFAAMQVVPMGFPCGVGTLTVHRNAQVATLKLPVYLP